MNMAKSARLKSTVERRGRPRKRAEQQRSLETRGAILDAAIASGAGGAVQLRVRNAFDEWRHLEAVVTDLRSDRQVGGVVLNARDITERVRLEEQLTRQAFHDDLTGLANRALFRDRLDHALQRSAVDGSALAVLLAVLLLKPEGLFGLHTRKKV
jgi:predicted signal transduction protein with EAL and GGDEF domain